MCHVFDPNQGKEAEEFEPSQGALLVHQNQSFINRSVQSKYETKMPIAFLDQFPMNFDLLCKDGPLYIMRAHRL